MIPATPHSNPAERLAALIDGLCAAVAAHGARGLLTLPLLLLLWSRLRRMGVRARRLAMRLHTGAPLPTPRPRSAPRAAPSRPYLRLPGGVTWLVRAVPATAVGAATLQFLLDQPDMAELAQLPPMGRLLRPLCRMLGVQPPPVRPPTPPAEAGTVARAGGAPHARPQAPPRPDRAVPIPAAAPNAA